MPIPPPAHDTLIIQYSREIEIKRYCMLKLTYVSNFNELRKKMIRITKITEHYPLYVTFFAYLISFLIVGFWANIPINDDYYYFTQVQAFTRGIFTKSALIGPSFVLQGFMGLLWSRVFGLTYFSLHMLTLVVTLFCIFGLYKIFSLIKINKKLTLFFLLLIAFIPEFYASSFTFMSENYLLMFVIWSIYFFLKYLIDQKNSNIILASILGGLSIMVRQYGVVLFPAYGLVYLLLKAKNNERTKIKDFVFISVPFVLWGLLSFLWPKFKSAGDLKSMNILLYFAKPELIIPRLTSISAVPYVFYFLLPVTSVMFLKLRTREKIASLALSIPIAYKFFKIDVFKIRNMFYLEGLYARLLINIRENLFNNTLFKLFLAYLISVSLVTSLFLFARYIIRIFNRRKELKKTLKIKNNTYDLNSVLLFVLIVEFYIVAVLTDRVFDRYLVNFFIILMIYAAYLLNKSNFKINALAVIMLAFTIAVPYLMTIHYYREMQLKWDLAAKIHELGVPKYRIFIDNVYARAMYMELTDNFDGRLTAKPANYHPICFVQEYTTQKKNILNDLINFVEMRAIVQRHFKNPTVTEAGILIDKSNHFDPTDILLFSEEYKSPVYNLLSRGTFVRAFCLSDYRMRLQ